MTYDRDILDKLVMIHTARHPDSRAAALAREITSPRVTAAQVKVFARSAGIDVRFVRAGWKRLPGLAPLAPLISTYADGGSEIWTQVDPANGGVMAWDWSPDGGETACFRTRAEVRRRGWRNEVLLVGAEPVRAPRERFGLGWFLREAFLRSSGARWIAFLSVVVTLFSLGMPVFFQVVVDKVLGVRATATLQTLLIGVSALVLLEAVGRHARDRLLNRAAELVDVRLGVWSFRHLLSLPLAFFETRPAGVLAKHMQQGDQAREFVTRTVVGGFLDLLTVLLFLPLLFWYSAALGGLVAAGAALMGLVIGVLVVPFNRRLETLYAAEADRQALLVETLRAVPGVKAAAAEPQLLARYERAIARTAVAHCRLMNLSEAAQAFVRGLEKALTVAIVGVGAWLCFDHRLSVGQLIAVQMLAHHVTGPVMRLVEAVYQFQRVRLAVRMLGEVMDAPAEPLLGGRGLRPALTGEIVVDEVTYQYPGALEPVLERFSLHVLPGDVVAITGPSGCGKSTLLKLLLGFVVPRSGRIRYGAADGNFYDLRDLDIRWVRSQIGTVLQTTEFLSDTVRANVALAHPTAPLAAIERAAAAAGAAGFVAEMRGAPDPETGEVGEGYEARLNEGAAGLSGGEKQRLGLARALLTDPPALFLDEPTAALDAASEQLVVQTLADLARTSRRTMVVITHRPALLSLPGCYEVRLS